MFDHNLSERSEVGRRRRPITALISAGVHGVLVSVLVVIPLIQTQGLSTAQIMTILVSPTPPPSAPPHIAALEVTGSAPAIASPITIDRERMIVPADVPTQIYLIEDHSVPAVAGVPGGMGAIARVAPGFAFGIPNSLSTNGTPVPPAPVPPPLPAPAPQVELPRIGGDVMQGELISQVQPVYPTLARTARQQGVVVLDATIGADGTIQGLRVVTGPPLLRQSAVDAVSQWVYRPYRLNGQSVPVRTTVTVTFSLQ